MSMANSAKPRAKSSVLRGPWKARRRTEQSASAIIAGLAAGGFGDVLRNAVELQQAVFDAIPANVALIDKDATIVAINQGWRTFARENGYVGDDYGIGSCYLSVCGDEPDASGGSVGHGIRGVLDGELAGFELEYPCHEPKRQRWFRVIVKAFSASDFEGAMVFHIDITDRKLAEIASLEARDAALSANEAKTAFMANVSHELHTPLNAIIGFSEILQLGQAGRLTRKQRDYAEDIRRSGQHLLAVINDLIDLSKADIDHFELAEGSVDPVHVSRDCLRMLAPRAEAAGVMLGLDAPDGLPDLRADRQRLSQIMLNLATNAVKFTPSGGRVTLRVLTDADGWLGLVVEDTGVGIPPEDQALVLTPFRRSRHEITRNREGTGLGLPLAKKLTEAHGGRLVLRSEVGEGTTVTVWFPPHRVIDLPT